MLVVAALAVPAKGATSLVATPAVGSASSGLTLLDLALGGHQLRVGTVLLSSDTTGAAPSASVVVTPVEVDGADYGQQTVTPASTPLTVPGMSTSARTPAALSGLVSASSPTISASASNTDGASSRVSTSSLGSLSVLGIPVQLDGEVSLGSGVDAARSAGEKTVTIRDVALPSIADLLGALGLDLSKLPPATLTTLTERLGLVTDTITTAKQTLEVVLAPLQPQLDAAEKQVADAQAAVDAATATLTQEQADLAAATSTLAAATQTLQGALPALRRAALLPDPLASPLPNLLPSPLPSLVPDPTSSPLDVPLPLPTDAATLPLVSPSPLPTISLPSDPTAATQLLVDAYTTAKTAYDAALAAVNGATTNLNTLNTLLNTASSTVNSLLAQVQTQVDALVAAVTSVLDATPLVSLDSVTVRTRAAASSASAGGQTSEVIGGEVSGLRVLGTDVLSNVLGSSTVSLTDLAGASLTAVTQAINGLTGTLSSVLSNVPTLPTLSVPAPTVGLLTKSTSTSVSGGFGYASNLVRVLQITLPAITLPAAVALPGASSLPAFATLPAGGTALVRAQALGDLVSTPITVGLGTLSDTVAFRPAASAQTAAPAGAAPGAAAPGGSTPGSAVPAGSVPGSTPDTAVPTGGVPQLPRTGLPGGLPVLAVLMVAGAVALRRRLVLP